MSQASKGGLESMGLLLGDRFIEPGGLAFSVALVRATAPLKATRSHVRFDADRFEALAQELDRGAPRLLIVGWYHSHLGQGCTLSVTDLGTQRRYFAAPHQVSWVLDPVRREAEAFGLEAGAAVLRALLEFDGQKQAAPEFQPAHSSGESSRKRVAYTRR